jgi:hypothetical protein
MRLVLSEDAFAHKELELILLESLNDELAIGCVEEEAVRLARADLELSHLNVVLSRSE